ncbi:MAG: helix-turn-helix domain-containing protein [Ruminococcaceae bacterium]|nr:helix-turn-helix domain-containing protein [Oscillospiraceae bacterium]
MSNYVIGETVKTLREERGMTQVQLAERLGVSDKTVSKWETCKGLPDITLLEPLAKALGVSVAELFSGNIIVNRNVSSNMLRSKLYVCPVCGNVIHTTGECVVTCCGIELPTLEAEDCDLMHGISMESVEDEFFVTMDHPMTKGHYISFIAHVTTDSFELAKLYPEGNAERRFKMRTPGYLYAYCNKHGLFRMKVSRKYQKNNV